MSGLFLVSADDALNIFARFICLFFGADMYTFLLDVLRDRVHIWSALVDTARSGGGDSLHCHQQGVSRQSSSDARLCRDSHCRCLVVMSGGTLPDDRSACRGRVALVCLVAIWISSLVR